MPSVRAGNNSIEVSHPIVIPFQPSQHSHEKAIFSSKISTELPDSPDGQIVNGIRTSNDDIPDGAVMDPSLNANLNGRLYDRSCAYSRDKLRSRDGSLTSFGVDGQESGRRSPRSSTSDSMRIGTGPNGYSLAMSNGRPISPTPPPAVLDVRPNSGTSVAPTRLDKAQSAGATDHIIVPATNTTTTTTTHHTVHRLSSPPIFQTPSPTIGAHSTPSSMQSRPPQLQHRHTLEVPKASNTRSSRDYSSSLHPNPSDVTSPSGRFSLGTSGTPGTRRASLTLGRRTTRSVHSDLHVDEIPQDEDAARWTEAIRQKRSSRRKRKEEEDDDRVVMGTKVDQNHVNWVTAYNMLTGIRFTVSRTNAKMDRELTDADFEAKHKFSFDITGNELTPSAKYDFKFKDYAPWVFRHLRARFKLDPADYLMSLTSKYILSELGSPGKSGSFFYFSRDYKYIIKTIHHGEHKLLRKILRDYYKHVQDNPDTLLSQFYGLHRVKIPYGKKIHFVVMNNLFPPHRDIHQTFDLKGSTIGRDFKEEDLKRNPRATLKDLNWLRRGLHLEFGPAKKDIFLAQVQRDVRLLQNLNLMDYSLLVGIHDLQKGNEENLRDKTLQVFQPGGEGGQDPDNLARTPSKLENARKARELRQIIKKEKPIPMDQSTNKMPDEMLEERKHFTFYGDDGGFRATHEDDSPGDVIYYLGIIDCLTHYGVIKKAEHFWKGLSHPKSQISPIAPESYGDRFIRFISGITKSPEEAAREKERNDNQQGMTVSSRTPTDRLMEKAERQAQQTEKEGAVEDESYDRTLSTVQVQRPSTELGGNTLPIVEEVGEAGSTSGRSGRSQEDPTTTTTTTTGVNRNGRNGGGRLIEEKSPILTTPLPPPAPPSSTTTTTTSTWFTADGVILSEKNPALLSPPSSSQQQQQPPPPPPHPPPPPSSSSSTSTTTPSAKLVIPTEPDDFRVRVARVGVSS